MGVSISIIISISIQSPWGWVLREFSCQYLTLLLPGDCENHSDVGVRAPPLHPREGGLLPPDLAASHVVQDVVLVPNIILSLLSP